MAVGRVAGTGNIGYSSNYRTGGDALLCDCLAYCFCKMLNTIFFLLKCIFLSSPTHVGLLNALNIAKRIQGGPTMAG